MPANECDISSSNQATSACVNGEQYAGVGPSLGHGAYESNALAIRSIAGTSARTAINAWGTARYVDNASTNSIFVPMKTAFEWNAFLNNLPAGITVQPAAVPDPGPFVIVPGSGCASPQPTTQTTSIPYYARPGSRIPSDTSAYATSVTFTCTVAGLCGTGTPSCGDPKYWTQTANIAYHTNPKPDDNGKVGWSVEVGYGGTAPEPNPAPINGACSSGRGGCSIGTTQNLSNAGYTWYWTCSGVYGGVSSPTCSDTDGSCGGSTMSCGTGNPVNQSDYNGTSTWNCSGINGGITSSCNMCDPGYVLVNGSCVLPQNGVCSGNNWACNSGNAFNGSSDGNYDYWYCSGSNTGQNSPQCSFALPKTGQCGGGDWSCNVGNAFSGSQDGYTDYWYCSGLNGGGNSEQCSFARAQNGQCGGNDWSCNVGSAFGGSSDSNNDYWYCSGLNGGGNSGQCSFAKPVNGACTNGSYTTQTQCSGAHGNNCNDYIVFSSPTCTSGQLVYSQGSYSWTCQGQNGGTSTTCSFVSADGTTTNYGAGNSPNANQGGGGPNGPGGGTD